MDNLDAAGPEPETPIIDSILEPRFCISLNVHGAYYIEKDKTFPTKLVVAETTVPPNLVIIEMGLPSQSVYARFYDYMYAIFVDPINLDFLYKPKFTMADFVRDRENAFNKDIKRAKLVQEAILRGDYDFFYKNPYYEGLSPEEQLEFQGKLEELDKIIRKVTIYTEGDVIKARSLTKYDKEVFDGTCTIDVRDPDLNPIKWETIKKNFFNTILDGISEKRKLPHMVKTTELINYLSYDSRAMKLIIFTCGHVTNEKNVTENLDDIILKLANEADALRAPFYKERINNSGPSPITLIKNKKSSTPYPRNWCIAYDTSDPSTRFLRVPIEEFVNNANEYINNATSSQGYGEHPDMEVICSKDKEYYPGPSSFLYIVLSPKLSLEGLTPEVYPIIKQDLMEGEYKFKRSTPIDKSFIYLTFTELITEYSELYDSMYLVSKGDMTLYKVEEIFNKYITKEEIKSSIETDKDTLHLYTMLAAQYIMPPFQLDGDKKPYPVMDFKTFRGIAGGYATRLTQANKLLSEIESLYEDDPDDISIYYEKYEKTLDKYKGTEVVNLMLKPRSGLPPALELCKNEDPVENISKFIELYIKYSYNDIQFIVDISAGAKSSAIKDDIEDNESSIEDYFVEYSKIMREYLLSQLSAGGAGAGGGGAGSATMNDRKRKRKTRKARKYKNRKSLRKKNRY